MKIYAYVRDGEVAEIIEPLTISGSSIPLKDRYHPDFVAQCVDISALDPRPQAGFLYDGKTFTAPAGPPVETVEDIRARALTEVRTERAPILNALAGMWCDAREDGDEEGAAAIAQARRDLKDITSLPAFLSAATYGDMKAAIMERYYEIAYSLPEGVRVAFREVFAK